MKKDTCALVLGGYVNGYSIIQELYQKGVRDIILFDYCRNIASYSNRIKKFILIDKTSDSIYQQLLKLNLNYEKIIIFPTDDMQLELLNEIYKKIELFCFIPFNSENLLQTLDKFEQYAYCEKIGVPYPKTLKINSLEDLNNISILNFPVIIKPRKRDDLYTEVFRSLSLYNFYDLNNNIESIKSFLSEGITFIASEIIPGDGSNIYAYVGYRSKNGKILNEWTGKKLSQFPDDFGVFSSASNEAPPEILTQGRMLLEGMNLYGICEPEFKFDSRDGKYKLMEINLRSMMWHRTGNRSKVYLQYTQWMDALGEQIEPQAQNKNRVIHYVYLKHEIINLFTRRGYLKVFIDNIWGGDERSFAVWDVKDLKPFMHDIIPTIKGLGGRWLRILKIKS